VPAQWPDAFASPGALPASGAAAGLLGVPAPGSAAGQVLATLAADMVSKQAALERLQRQADAADARCDTAAARLRDMQGRNQ
jgi:hypothetical protein